MLRELIFSIRQNHALEHATIHILSRRNPGIRLAGRSSPSGFSIYGAVATEDVAGAAAEALMRLQRGEANLAIHPNCGTNVVVTGLLVGSAGFAAGVGRSRSRWERLPLALLAATLAAIVAQPLAHLTQQRITTTPAQDGVRLAGIRRQVQGGLVVHRLRVEHG
jgi:hypothetical protein